MRITLGELRALIAEAKGSKWMKHKEDKLIAVIKALPTHPLAGHRDIAKNVWDKPLFQASLASPNSTTPVQTYQWVKLSDLHPTQDEVSRKHLIWLLQHDAERRSERPKVVIRDGKYVVVDGHHRVAVTRIEGMEIIQVDFYE